MRNIWRKVCARLYLFPQCAIYEQDLHNIVLTYPMRNICARLYFFPQCAIYVQHLHKTVLPSPMRNICARSAQDCTSFSNVQYMHKICARLHFFRQWAIYVQDCTSLPAALGPLTIYAQNIIILQVIKFSIILILIFLYIQ